MRYQQTQGTTFPLIKIDLDRGEKIQIENGSMVYHNGKVELEGIKNSNGQNGLGGMMRALGRSVSSGESYYITFVTGQEDGAQIAIAPSTPGMIYELNIGETPWRLNTGVFLACDTSVNYNMVRQKLSGALLGGTGGLFVMETQGTGSLLVNSYGDIVELDLDGTNPMVIDNQHVIAWENTLDYQIEVASGIFGFRTGEGLVNKFHGKGRVLIQTRNMQALASDLNRFSASGS